MIEDLRDSINLPDFNKKDNATHDECLLDETLDAAKILADLSVEDLTAVPELRTEITMVS